MKLRLLTRPDCNRACPGCCNKGWRLHELPVCESYEGYTEVMITGGEPMLDYRGVIEVAREVRRQNEDAKIWLYTAKTSPVHELGWTLTHLDGLTVTLHEQNDVEPFLAFARYVELWKLYKRRNLRVNVFKPIVLPDALEAKRWIPKIDMEWIVDCPLPADEVFMQTKHGITPANIGVALNWTGRLS